MHANSTSSHPFRDGTAGVEAKRRELLRDRRDDLATMSHEIRRIYVSRQSRLAAFLGLSLGGGLTLVAALSENTSALVGELLPGSAPAPLSTLLLCTWLLGGFAYMLGRAVAEHRFSVAMSRAVLPTQDLHVDVARLECEAPDTVGRRMVRQCESLSRLAPVLAAGLVGPASLLTATLIGEASGYPKVDDIELLLGDHAGSLLAVAALSGVFGLLMALRPNWRPRRLAALSASLSVPAALALGVSPLPVLIAGSACLPLIALLSRRQHLRQNRRIEQEGTPLPAVFNLRQQLAVAWRALRVVLRCLTRENLRLVLRTRPGPGRLFAALMLVCLAAVVTATLSSGGGSVQASAGATSPVAQSPVEPSNDGLVHRVESDGDGAIIAFYFDEDQPIDASHLLDGAVIPSGWRAVVNLSLIEGEDAVFVEAFSSDAHDAAPRQLNGTSPDVELEHVNCSGRDMPLVLKAAPYGDWPSSNERSLRLRYQVQLEMISGCTTH